MSAPSPLAAASRWPWQLWAGLAVLAATWLGPLPAMTRTAFSPSMIVHLSVMALASPLIAIGISRLPDLPRLPDKPALLALAAAIADMVVVIGWHISYFHEAAARSWMAYSIEQITFLLAGLGIWCIGFLPTGRRSALWGAVAFFMSFMHMTVLGCVLLFVPHLLYDPDVCQGAFGLAPLQDQQFGGILMAGWGAFVYAGGGVALFRRVLVDHFAGAERADLPAAAPTLQPPGA